MNVYDAQGKSIWLGESVGRGGEATVYRVRSQTGWLAKIYEQGARPEYADKLAWMISHPPENPTRSIAHPSLAWPSAVLYDSKHILVGYLMPHIQTAVPLLDVFNPRRRQATLPRFDRRYLHRTARNLAATLTALHVRGYVVGDLNESNVLVKPSALISMIDVDSFQVQEVCGNQILCHPCPVGKLEYTPPELHRHAIGSIVRQPEHDVFALGVLIFQLLMEGSHPFRAQWLGSGDPPTIETRIAQGVFPYSTFPDSRVRPPKGAPDLNQLHPALVELVFRCFIDGHKDPQQRPAPEKWVQALVTAENALRQCPNHHLYSNHLSECPHCGAAASKKTTTTRQTASPHSGSATHPAGQKSPNPQPNPQPRPQPNPQPRPQPNPQPRPQPNPQQRTQPRPRPAQPNTGFGRRRAAPATPAFNWQAFIASRMNIPWPQATYPFGIPYQPRPASPPPARPQPSSQPVSGPANHIVGLRAWARPRLTKSFLTGGGMGAMIGASIGILAGLASASLGEIAAWTLIWSLGGAAAGVLRGWKPGYKLSTLVDSHVGWDRLLPMLGLLSGAMVGMLVGLVIGWWAIIPVFIGLIYGARFGKRVGLKLVDLGSRIGWNRIWAGLSAGVAALFGWQAAVWLSGGAVGSLLAQGITALSGWFSGSTPNLLVTAAVSGMLCGGLAGAVSGSLTDLVARFCGLVD
jgi:serine/threonine protein kinase